MKKSLPRSELDKMFEALYVQGLGSFTNLTYWSSSADYVPAKAWMQYFSSGTQQTSWTFASDRVRAIRAF